MVAPNLYDPVEGRRHDSGMLADSNLLNLLRQYSIDSNGNTLCIYGDPAYPLHVQLQGPFKGAQITALQQDWNKRMSEVRVSVEWVFGDNINYFMDFKNKLKVGLSAVGKMYMHNARCCLYD